MRRPPNPVQRRLARPTRQLPRGAPVAWAVALGVATQAPQATPAHAQPAAGPAPLAFDVGLAHIQQAGAPPLVAPSVGASWRERLARGTAGVAVVGAAGDGRIAAQLAADGSRAFGPAAAPFEVTAELRGVRVPNTPWSAQLLAGVRQHGVRRWGGVWAGAQGGVARQVGEAWPSAVADAGAWWRVGRGGRAAVTATAATARVEARGLVAAGVEAYGPARVATGDLIASYERAAGRVEVGAWAGVRGYATGGLRALPADDADSNVLGPRLHRRALAVVTATAWLAPAVGVTASAGVLPNDLVRGLPAARHVVLALRVRPGARTAVVVPAPVIVRPAGTAGPELRVDDLEPESRLHFDDVPPSTRRLVRVAAPTARRVQLRADATGWRAVELTRGPAGEWEARVVLAPGTHRVLVCVDGGAWRPPANLPAVDDDLGGRVGLLVVP